MRNLIEIPSSGEHADFFARMIDEHGLSAAREAAEWSEKTGMLPIAGGGTVQNPVAQPLGGPTISGTQITVDTYLNPPTKIPTIIRNLVASNRGYFAEEIFSTPGFTVQGGAIIYEETFPEDYFLPADQSIAPRAPGSEAPRLGSTRHAPKIARPESWSGSIEVTDEARRRNDVRSVQRQFTQAANTFADRIQTRAVATLQAAITAWGRTVSGGNWRAALTSGVPNADPQTLPQRDFALVEKQFITDEAGMTPNIMIVHPDDAFYLDVIYGDKLPALLQRYNLTMRVSVAAPVGDPIFVRGGGVGVMAFEKPLDQEYTREGTRKTDVYTLESVPVFVADDASSVLQLLDIDA
jgi:hypothetical protein